MAAQIKRLDTVNGHSLRLLVEAIEMGGGRLNVVFFRTITEAELDVMVKSFESRLRKNCYVCYTVDCSEQVIYNQPWYKNCKLAVFNDVDFFGIIRHKKAFSCYLNEFKSSCLLVNRARFSKNEVTDESSIFMDWIRSLGSDGGNVKELAFSDPDIFGWQFESNNSKIIITKSNLFDYMSETTLKEVFSDFEFKTDEYVDCYTISPLFVYGLINYTSHFLNLVSKHYSESLALKNNSPILHLCQSIDQAMEVTEKGEFSIVSPFDLSQAQSNFDYATFKNNINTKKLGKIILHADIVSSTIDIFDKFPFLYTCLPENIGLCVIASQQSSGKGRNANKWLSPIGSMCLTFPFKVEKNSRLMKHPSIIQHMIALSFVCGIKSLPGMNDLPIYVKWPNDIYYKNKYKLGGVLVKSFSFGSNFIALASIGANIANSKPTVSLNSIIEKVKGVRSDLKIEKCVAITLNKFEELVQEYNNDFEYGHIRFQKLYTSNLIKYNEAITVVDPRNNSRISNGVIDGIDEFGFLKIRFGADKCISVQPDGNTFDITENPIMILNQH